MKKTITINISWLIWLRDSVRAWCARKWACWAGDHEWGNIYLKEIPSQFNISPAPTRHVKHCLHCGAYQTVGEEEYRKAGWDEPWDGWCRQPRMKDDDQIFFD